MFSVNIITLFFIYIYQKTLKLGITALGTLNKYPRLYISKRKKKGNKKSLLMRITSLMKALIVHYSKLVDNIVMKLSRFLPRN